MKTKLAVCSAEEKKYRVAPAAAGSLTSNYLSVTLKAAKSGEKQDFLFLYARSSLAESASPSAKKSSQSVTY